MGVTGMKTALTIGLAALLLSGCIAQWKNPNGPQRWSGSPNIPPMGFNNSTPPLQRSGP